MPCRQMLLAIAQSHLWFELVILSEPIKKTEPLPFYNAKMCNVQELPMTQQVLK